MHEFTVDGTTFAIEPLKLKQALKAEALLVEVLLPAFASLAGASRGIVDPASLAALERLPELVDIFLGRSWVDWAKGGTATTRVPLASFADLVFERRNAALLAWLSACIEWQFADFFDAAGRSLLAGAANRFSSLLESIGGSGGSSPTDGSPTA